MIFVDVRIQNIRMYHSFWGKELRFNFKRAESVKYSGVIVGFRLEKTNRNKRGDCRKNVYFNFIFHSLIYFLVSDYFRKFKTILNFPLISFGS